MVLGAIAGDPVLTDRQRAVLVDVYQSFVASSSATLQKKPQTRTTTSRATRPTKSVKTQKEN